MGEAIRAAFQRLGRPYDPACVVPFTSTVCQMVEACGGVGIIDELTVRHLRQPDLVTIPMPDMPAIWVVVFHRREPLSAPVQDLLHCLTDV